MSLRNMVCHADLLSRKSMVLFVLPYTAQDSVIVNRSTFPFDLNYANVRVL